MEKKEGKKTRRILKLNADSSAWRTKRPSHSSGKHALTRSQCKKKKISNVDKICCRMQ